MAEPPLTFSEGQSAAQRTARFSLVPWAARLLGEGPLRGKSDPLPVGDPASLTAEVVEALGDMMNRAVWRFLARDCGWRSVPSVIDSAAGREGSHGSRRLWERMPAEMEPPTLQFTAESIDLLVAVYNGTRGSARLQDLQPVGCEEANGDLLLHHVIFRRLTGSAQALGVDTEFDWARWLANPLNSLWRVSADPPEFSRLTDPDLSDFIPWIGSAMGREWQRESDEIWSRLDRAIEWFVRLERLARSLIDAFRDRPDLAVFLLEFFSGQAARAETQCEQFESRVRGMTSNQRQEAAIPWAGFLRSIEALEELHRQNHQIHPVERGVSEKCFLAAWQEMTFSEAVATLNGLRRRLRPTLS